MKYALLKIYLELLFGKERDNAGCDEVDKALRIVIYLIFEGPLALRYNQTENLDLTLSVFITVSCRLPVARNALEEHSLISSDFLGDKFEDWDEDGQKSHVFSRLVDDIFANEGRLLAPIICNIIQ